MEIPSFLKDISLLKDIIVPGAAALGAVWIATRKFKKEQLWKERYAAYQGVLRSLESISHWASETQSSVHLLPTTGTKNIADEYSLAQREVLRQVTIGSLLLSAPFCEQLEKFTEEFHTERFNASEDHYDNQHDEDMAWSEHAGRIYTIVDRHLPRLIELARDDVGA